MTPAPQSAAAARVVAGRVSVVVPTRNSGRTLRACLDALRSQDHGDVELVVVDNSSSDDTSAIARVFADRLVERCGPERSAQRNQGAVLATGEFLIFVDSDQELSRDVAGDIARALSGDPTLGALVIPELSHGQGFLAACRAAEKRLYLGDPSVEAARAFRRVAFDAVGGFDEDLYAAEDFDLADRVAHAGWRTGRVDALVWHDEGRVRLRDVFAKKRYYGSCLPRYFRGGAGGRRRLARPSLLRVVPGLARDPGHAGGLVVLKLVDAFGLLAGALTGAVTGRLRPASEPTCDTGSGAASKRTRVEEYAHAHPQLATRAPIPALLVAALDTLPRTGGVVCDVGCGEGATLRAVGARDLGATVVGCDLSQHRAAIANTGRAAALVGDAERLPFASAACDLVICRHVVEHVDDAVLLGEIARVLRPGAVLYLETPLRLRFAWYPYRNAAGRWVLDPTHVREYASLAEISAVIHAAGLQLVASEVAPIRYPLDHLAARLAFGAFRPRDGHDAGRWSGDRWAIRVPRYRELRLLARHPPMLVPATRTDRVAEAGLAVPA